MRIRTVDRELVSIFGVWVLFATLLAFITSRHELYLDEVQPWLWVRFPNGLFTAIQHLHYEGHPAVWVVLLYGVSRISSNVVLIQYTNYILGLVAAGLILSARRVPLLVRALLVFGVSFFFIAGVLARNYMLSSLLLIASVRCLLAVPQRRWAAIALLILAINSHFLAIPAALGTFVWLYWLEPRMDVTTAVAKFRSLSFLVSAGLMVGALLVCYLTVRPASDIETVLDIPGADLFQYFVFCAGRIWHYLLPVTLDATELTQNGHLTIAAYRDVLISLLLFLLAVSVLPSRRSRYFMTTCTALWTAAAMCTVRKPLETHVSLLAVCYIAALLITRTGDDPGTWLPLYAAQPVLIAILAIQVSLCLQFSTKEIFEPFSAGKSVARWIQSEGLTGHPLVSQPEIAAPAVMAYTGIGDVYFPACQCNRKYLLYNRGWTSNRPVTRAELDSLKESTGSTPVVLSGWELSPEEQTRLGLHLGFRSAKGFAFQVEDVTVYVGGPADEVPKQISGP